MASGCWASAPPTSPQGLPCRRYGGTWMSTTWAQTQAQCLAPQKCCVTGVANAECLFVSFWKFTLNPCWFPFFRGSGPTHGRGTPTPPWVWRRREGVRLVRTLFLNSSQLLAASGGAADHRVSWRGDSRADIGKVATPGAHRMQVQVPEPPLTAEPLRFDETRFTASSALAMGQCP